MQGQWSIEQFADVKHVYGILDDLDWDVLRKYYKPLLGCQKDITVTDKYCKKKTFVHGFPVVVCTNELPEFTKAERDWLSVNVDFFCIEHSLLPNNMCIEWIKINI